MPRFSYDLRQQRTTTWYLIDLSAGQSDPGVLMRQTYDADGHLRESNTYFASGDVVYYATPDAPKNPVYIGG